ncbi:MAG: TolC family protein [Novosphingobium sp.]
MPKAIAALASVLVLAGCALYTPAPLVAAALALQQDAVALDESAVADKVHAMAPAAPYVPGKWNRLSLLAAALIYNPGIAAAQARIESAAAQARAARQAPGSTLTLASEYANDTSASSPWLLGGALDVPLDIGGVRRARIAGAALTVDDARYAYAEKVWSVRMAIERALVDRIASEERAGLYHALANLRARQLAAAERRVAAGAASRTDLERVRAAGADAARLAVDADRAVGAAKIALAAAVGLPEASFANTIWTGFADPAPLASQAVSREQLRQAMLARPDILRAMVAYGQAEEALRGEVARQYPQITVSPGYTWERGLVKLPFNVGLALPPLDLNRHAIAAAEAKRSEMGKQVEAAVASGRAAIDRALSECRAARAALAHVRKAELPAAEELAKRADRELAAGSINRVDWASARAGELTARINASDALVRVRRADAALEDAVHRPLSGPELLITPSRGHMQ